jgi:anti-anti-sigma regulatory factor
MTRLRSDIECARPVAVVRLSGALDVMNVATAWDLLVKLLAEQPDALVIDASEVRIEDTQVVIMFGAVARRAGVWPGVPVILVAPDQAMRDALHRQAVDRQLAVCADRDEALLLADGAPMPLRLREPLPPNPGAARQARDLITEACLRWDLPGLVAPASIIASELVSNGVRHAGTPLELALARTARYLHIAVRDSNPRPALLQHPSRLSAGGRGLLIVQGTALTWGSTPTPNGKVVWATLGTDPRAGV